MDFTYNAYKNLIERLRDNKYNVTNYKNYSNYDKCAILRHDIDYSVDKALKFAEFERQLDIRSTYFVLISSPFYNIIEKKTNEKIKKIKSLGHDIGLHFDELNYSVEYYDQNGGIKNVILSELKLLRYILGIDVDSVSMHRPSKITLDADYDLSPAINSYGNTFFKQFKYLSDSRMRWRENIEDIIEADIYKRLHILTHAFWYDKDSRDIKKTLFKFIKQGNSDRYDILGDNITDLKSLVKKDEV